MRYGSIISLYTGGHVGFQAINRNAQHLRSGCQRIWNQHPQIIQKQLKNKIYVTKQALAGRRLDYNLLMGEGYALTSRVGLSEQELEMV